MVFISGSLIYWVPGSEIGQNVGVGVLMENSWSQARMDDKESLVLFLLLQKRKAVMIGAIPPRKTFDRPFPLSILKKNQKIENLFLGA